MAVTFDRIHTKKKQRLLREMMDRTARRVAAMSNPTPHAEACQICGSTTIAPYIVAYGFGMARCADCGLIFCDPYPSSEQLLAYYNSEMRDFENEFFRDSFDARVEIFSSRIELIHAVKYSGRLLDIGSAIGIFIESLTRANAVFEVTACDMSSTACAELRKNYPNITVVNDDAANLTVDHSYDVVTMWDTLEHVVNLHEMLHTIRGLLAPEGLFVFSTPNTHSFEWLVAGEKHVQILPPGHVNLMNAANIRMLLDQAGFEVADQHTMNASLDIGYVQKLLVEDTVASGRADAFLKQALSDPDFKALLSDYLVSKTMAGNVVTLARPR